jgi:voltage-gated potassium channel
MIAVRSPHIAVHSVLVVAPRRPLEKEAQARQIGRGHLEGTAQPSGDAYTIGGIARLILFEKPLSRFLREPVTVRGAVSTIVTATLFVVVVSGALMRLLDPHEYPNLFVGMWWALQTVTTVGYGDVTPQQPNGRFVAAVVMFEGIALIAIVTAAVTSSFVERAQVARRAREDAEEKPKEEQLDARLDDLAARLDDLGVRLERVDTMLRTLTNT